MGEVRVMEKAYHILVIEDDRSMAEEIARLLSGWRYQVSLMQDFTQIVEEATMINPQIIFLSSRESSMDVVMAMNNGGDDYIQKPFDSSVLIAKLQAMLRRTYEMDTKENKVLLYKGMKLHIEEMTLSYQEQVIELTKNEFRILKLLLEHKGEIVSRSEMMKRLWDDEIYVNENTLTVNVNRLRSRLEEMGLHDVIATKKGIGYSIS